MTFWEIFFVVWIGSGLAAFGYFQYWMSKTYPDIYKIEENDFLALELIIAFLGGPINWLAVAVIIDTHEKGKDDEDDMEV